ncbi:hypothetical protein NDR87_16725 [Nocardia sp. CDC159]|uniref:Nitroreductase family protein n=1 Tax=Nocardia pulmonis TaxID=2951408 RepID=A0A9X2EBD1_9NOCA|nr:hypothetical protein [Nocardia pulmonis]MCM6788005.1 hypothetical protein [Nocardia sp. CDC159]
MPFVWSILLAARSEGYGGTITTLVVAEEPRVKELLGVPESFALAAVLPLGMSSGRGIAAECFVHQQVRQLARRESAIHLELERRSSAVLTWGFD